MRGSTLSISSFRLRNPAGHLLYERGSLKVLNGLLAELRLDVVGPEPLDHVDVAGGVPEGLRGGANPVLNRLATR